MGERGGDVDREQQTPRSSRSQHDGHPGTRVVGLCAIDSCGGEDAGESRAVGGPWVGMLRLSVCGVVVVMRRTREGVNFVE